jgi:hypothetical protein
MTEENNGMCTYYKNEIAVPTGRSNFDIYLGEVSHLWYFKDNPSQLGFSIQGDLNLTKYERTETTQNKRTKIKWFPPTFEIEKIPKNIDKKVWNIEAGNCSFYRNQSGVYVIAGAPRAIDLGKDENFYIAKMQEKGKEKDISLEEKFIREVFNPILKKIKFGYLCENYKG